MDKNFIRIDDLVRQHLEGAEEQERSGAWLNMRDLLDKEMPRKKRIAVFYWRRLFGLVAAVSLVGTVAVGSYELSSAYRGDAGDLVPLIAANPVASRESGNAVLEAQGADTGNELATGDNITVRGNAHLARMTVQNQNISAANPVHEHMAQGGVTTGDNAESANGSGASMAANQNSNVINGGDLSASITARRRVAANNASGGAEGTGTEPHGANVLAAKSGTGVVAHTVPVKPLTEENPKARNSNNRNNPNNNNATNTGKNTNSYTSKDNGQARQRNAVKTAGKSPVAGNTEGRHTDAGSAASVAASKSTTGSRGAAPAVTGNGAQQTKAAARGNGAAIVATSDKGTSVAKVETDKMPGAEGSNGLPKEDIGTLNSGGLTGLTTTAPNTTAPVATTEMTTGASAADNSSAGMASGAGSNKAAAAGDNSVATVSNTGNNDASKSTSSKAATNDNTSGKAAGMGESATVAGANKTNSLAGNTKSVSGATDSKAGAQSNGNARPGKVSGAGDKTTGSSSNAASNTNSGVATKGNIATVNTVDLAHMPLSGTAGKPASVRNAPSAPVGNKSSAGSNSGNTASKSADTYKGGSAATRTTGAAITKGTATNSNKVAGKQQTGHAGNGSGNGDDDNQRSDNKVMNKVVVRERQVKMNDNETRTEVDTLSVETMNRGGGNNDEDGAEEAIAAKASAKKAEDNTGTEESAVASNSEPESVSVTAKRRRGRGRRNAANVSAAAASGNEDATATEAVPAAAMPVATADEAEASKSADETTETAKKTKAAKRSGVSLMQKMRAAFNDVKQNASGARFHAGITAGFNNNFFGPSNMRGFQFGVTGNMEFNESWNMMAELKYFHRVNNNTLDDSYYSYMQVGNQYRRSLVQNTYDFAAMHTVEMPVTIRYAKGNFNFYTGGNFLYSFSLNTAPATYADPNAASTMVSTPGADNAPKYSANDFHSRFGLGYILGFSYQVAPNTSLDLRNVQTVWDNATTTGAKSISSQLYRTPSVQLSIMYRLGGNRNKE